MAVGTQNTFHSLNPELKTEFYTCFKEAMDELDSCFSILDEGYQEEVVHEMFRSVHSIKGNCHLVFLDDIADVCHKLEDIVSQIRTGEYRYVSICGEFLTLIFQRLEQLVRQLIKGKDITTDDFLVLDRSVEKVFNATPEARDAVIHQTLESLSGVLTSSENISAKILQRLNDQDDSDAFDDMAFMQHISGVMRYRSLRHHCDTDKLLKIAEYLSEIAEQGIDFEQLKAAVYMNLLGSKFVTSPLFDITPESEDWERQRLSEQLDIAAGFLKLSGKWAEAAVMVEQSFARYDGKGMPETLSGNHINSGAMILSLLRFYQQEYRKACAENKKKIAVGKAMRKINSEQGYRFDPRFVQRFSLLAKEQSSLLYI